MPSVAQMTRDLNKAYEIEPAPIGGGEFGTIYKARHLSLDDRRAIKVFAYDPDRMSITQEHWKRIIYREASIAIILSRQRTRYLVQCYDFISPDQTPSGMGYLIMELVEGITLSTRIHQRGKIAPHTVFDIIWKLGSALDMMHSVGVVHRDIKADNIKFRDNDLQQPVLLDFGVAEAIGSEPADTIAGTTEYMAPEAFEACLSASIDLYSLGVVAYEMLMGKLRQDRQFHLEQIKPVALRDVILQAVASDPKQRFDSGYHFAAAFAAALKLPPPARTDVPEDSAPKRPGRLRRVILLVGIIVIVVSGALLYWKGQSGSLAMLSPVASATAEASSTSLKTPVAANSATATTPTITRATNQTLPTSTNAEALPTRIAAVPTRIGMIVITETTTGITSVPTLTNPGSPSAVFATVETNLLPADVTETPIPSPSATRTLVQPPSPTQTLIPDTNTPTFTATPDMSAPEFGKLVAALQAASDLRGQANGSGIDTQIDCTAYKVAYNALRKRRDMAASHKLISMVDLLKVILDDDTASTRIYSQCGNHEGLFTVPTGSIDDLDTLRMDLARTADKLTRIG